MANIFTESLHGLKNTQITAIASSSTDKLESFSKRLGIDQKFCFNDYSELFKCESTEIIYITLPNNYHFEYIQEALNNGKHVLVEKPAFISLDEAKVISKLKKEKKLYFFEGFSYLHNPVTKELIEKIEKGVIGEIQEINLQIGYDILPRYNSFQKLFDRFKPQHRLFKENMGGGCIMDLGCYLSSFIQLLVNIENFEVLRKDLVYDFKEVEVEANLSIMTNDRVTAHLHCSFNKVLEPKIFIKGSKGNILINNLWDGKNISIKLNNRSINSARGKIGPFSSQIIAINQALLSNENECNLHLYARYSSRKNMNLLEYWKH